MKRSIGPAAAAALAIASPALANDSTALLGAGGLELIRNDVVKLLSEELYVSADTIRVEYRFRNTTAQPARYLVAFPLPVIDARVPEEMNIVLPDPDSENFVSFEVVADGVIVPVDLYERASAFGIDYSDTLRGLGLPLNPLAEGGYDLLQTEAPSTVAQLNRLGLVISDDYGHQAAWRYEATFHWEQTFPPDRDVVVEHAYHPVVGCGFFGDYDLGDADLIARYCMDEPFIRAVHNRLAAAANTPTPYLQEERISYILTTANNWAAPIGSFRLVVDKGSTEALVSFCGEGITKIGATEFEVTAENFVAERELEVLIVRPSPQR